MISDKKTLEIENQIRDFCLQHGAVLSEHQRVMVNYHYRENRFLGLGRAVGRSVLFPLINLNNPTVIDESGHYQLAALDTRIGFTSQQPTETVV